MAEIAEIKDSGRGREWVASRDMKKGEQVVLTAPLAAVLRVEHMSTHCGRCFIPLSTSHDGGSGKTPEVCEGCSFFTVCHECAQAEVNCDGQGGACEGVFAVHRECGECFVLQVFLQPLSFRMHEACAHRLPDMQEGDMLDTTTRMLLRLEHARRREKPPMPGQQAGTGTSSGMLKALSGLRGLDLLEQHRSVAAAAAPEQRAPPGKGRHMNAGRDHEPSCQSVEHSTEFFIHSRPYFASQLRHCATWMFNRLVFMHPIA